MIDKNRVQEGPDILTALIIAQKTKTSLGALIHSLISSYAKPLPIFKKSWFVFNRNFITCAYLKLETKNPNIQTQHHPEKI